MADLRDVNLNRMLIFVAVVKTGSLTRAAERLGLAKTMVSKHMQRLEAEVGASLPSARGAVSLEQAWATRWDDTKSYGKSLLASQFC